MSNDFPLKSMPKLSCTVDASNVLHCIIYYATLIE